MSTPRLGTETERADGKRGLRYWRYVVLLIQGKAPGRTRGMIPGGFTGTSSSSLLPILPILHPPAQATPGNHPCFAGEDPTRSRKPERWVIWGGKDTGAWGELREFMMDDGWGSIRTCTYLVGMLRVCVLEVYFSELLRNA